MKLAAAGFWIFASAMLWASNASAEIKVGIVVSASGPGSALGQPQMRTVAALPKEIGGEKVTYIPLDDESDPTKGSQNARRLVERGNDIYLDNGLSTMSPTDHNGYDERSTFLIKVEGGKFRLLQAPQ